MATIAAIVLEDILLALPVPEFAASFAIVAVVEEGLKFVVVWAKPYRSSHFNEVMDGIVYATAASLGFATVENLLYVLGPGGGLGVGIVRALVSVPGHVSDSGIMGFYLGLAKPFRNQSEGQERHLMAKGLLIAIALHGSYDALLSLGGIGFVPALAVTLISWVIFLRLTKKALSLSPFRWRTEPARETPAPSSAGYYGPSQMYCTNCGVRLIAGGKFCANCGTRLSI